MSNSFIQSMHMPLAALLQQPVAWQQKVLGAINFLADTSPLATSAEFPVLAVPARILEGEEHACEVWLAEGPVTHGQAGNLRYSHDNEWLFGVIEIEESRAAQADTLQKSAEAAYRQIFALLDRLGYAFIYRFWNYMANINGFSQNLERYRQFNIGRQEAYLACQRQINGQLPAACALGTHDGPLAIAFLAGRRPAHSIENPRQLSAYQYPEQYGPRSPTFSRANMLRHAEADILMISGTASIVGHETLHSADPHAQTQESLTNIAVLIHEANRLLGRMAFDPAQMLYRVYVRHPEHMSLIKQAMQQVLGPGVKACYVQADICRSDLLMEIEATAISSVAEAGAAALSEQLLA